MNLHIYITDGCHHCFGLDETGETVAYLSCLLHQDIVELCGLEVREGYRGRGYSKTMIDAVQEYFGKTLVHTGGYTPDGLERIAHYFHSSYVVATMRAEFSPMSFVYDWEQLTTL